MSQAFPRETLKPKKNTDSGVYGATNKRSSFFLSEEEDDLQIKTLQSIF